jgi:hypothetical protein
MADNLTATFQPIIWKMLKPHSPVDLHGLLQGQLHLSFFTFISL